MCGFFSLKMKLFKLRSAFHELLPSPSFPFHFRDPTLYRRKALPVELWEECRNVRDVVDSGGTCDAMTEGGTEGQMQRTGTKPHAEKL
jgi:SH3-like domain-containing protein